MAVLETVCNLRGIIQLFLITGALEDLCRSNFFINLIIVVTHILILFLERYYNQDNDLWECYL